MTATAVLCVMLAAPAAPVPKERAEAEKVVGTWKLVKSTNSTPGVTVDLTLELAQSGKLTIRQSTNGGPVQTYEGEYKVVKGEIPYSVNYPGGGVKKETLAIKKLTDTELVVVDPAGIREDFERVKKDEKKEEEK